MRQQSSPILVTTNISSHQKYSSYTISILWFYIVIQSCTILASKVNNSIKPEIIVHPKTQEIQRRSNVTLRCVATVLFPETQIFGLTEEDRRARTSMNIEWYFDGNGRKERLIRDKIVKTSPQVRKISVKELV